LRIRRHHVIHSTIAVVTLVLIGFSLAFLVDAIGTAHTYDTLGARHVAVQGQIRGCAFVGPTSRTGQATAEVCRLDYHYDGHHFTTVIGHGQSTVMVVDPHDLAVWEPSATYSNDPREIHGDLLLAFAFGVTGLAVGAVHLDHLRRHRRRARARTRHADPEPAR